MLVDFLVRIYDVLKFDALLSVRRILLQHLNCLVALMDLAYTVDRTHDQLVQMSSEKKIRLETKCHQQDVPNELAALLTYLQVLAHLLNSVSSDLLYPIKEYLELSKSLFLSLLPGMYL